MYQTVRFLKDLFFPPRCVFCDRVIAAKDRPVCHDCRQKPLARISEDCCPSCGREKAFCSCRQNHLLSDGIAAPFYYADSVKDAIALFKRYDDRDRTSYFVQELSETAYRAFGDRQIDCITVVPIFTADKAQRGFDQVEPLAKQLSRELHVPYVRLLQKVIKTPPQKTLNFEQRCCNLLGAFDILKGYFPENQSILLVDDVVTTGSTTNECAKMLKIYGAKKVYVLAIALTKAEQGA